MDIVNHMDKKFVASHEASNITAEEWFAVRDLITQLKKQVEQLQWQLRQQD